MSNLIDMVLEKLKEIQNDILEFNPPPYEYPSDAGRINQLISDTINMAEIIKKKSVGE